MQEDMYSHQEYFELYLSKKNNPAIEQLQENNKRQLELFKSQNSNLQVKAEEQSAKNNGQLRLLTAANISLAKFDFRDSIKKKQQIINNYFSKKRKYL